MTPKGYFHSRESPEGLRLLRHAWMNAAACKNVGPDIFFDKKGEALSYCWRCPVAQDCADYAHTNNLQGIWGGLTDAQRAKGMRCMPEPERFREDQSEVAEQVRRLHREGLSWTQITARTGVHYRNVARILARRRVS